MKTELIEMGGLASAFEALRLPYGKESRGKFDFDFDVFYRSYEEFRNAVDGGLFKENTIDCKEYIEKHFNIKL